MTISRKLELTLLPHEYAVARLEPNAPLPKWAAQGHFFSITRSSDELSVVCEEAFVPQGLKCQPNWRILRVHGPFAFTEVGVLASIASPLADAKISLFVVSSFDTDHLLVQLANLDTAIAALEQAGHLVHRSAVE
jgi:uncharacterized protein